MSGGENQGGYFGPATSFAWKKFIKKTLRRLVLCVVAVTLLVIVVTILLIRFKVPI